MKGILTLIGKSAESRHRTPGTPVEVEFPKLPTIGERFECVGEALTPGATFRWISTSGVTRLEQATDYADAISFWTETGSEYRLVPNNGTAYFEEEK